MESDSTYYYGLGLEYFEKGDFENAIEHFMKSLELKTHFKTYERIFECLKNQGRYDEAKIYIEKAYEMNKKNDKVIVEYATVLVDEGNNKQAIELLKDLLERNTTNGPAKRLLDKLV